MKRLSTLFIFLLPLYIFSQSIVGSWKGDLDVMGNKLPLIFHIEKEADNYRSKFDSPMQGAHGILLQKTTVENGEIIFDASNLGIVYKAKILPEKIDGTFSQGGMDFPLILTKTTVEEAKLNRPQTPKAPFNYDNEEVTFKNETEGNLLAGTLTAPKNFSKKSPILVMITGSGAQNRDEELFEHKPFLVIADDFSKKGIATLRLDDRGIGGSESGKDSATSADFAGDISSAVNFLIKRGYTNIGLIGHSEGGMIAPMVANSNKNVKYLILMAGPGIPIKDLLVKQNYDVAKAYGSTEEALKITESLNRNFYNYVVNYNGNNLENDLSKKLRDALNELPQGISDKTIDEQVKHQIEQITNPWFYYFIKFNPDKYLSKVKIPVLAINGSLDLQVSAKENLAGIKKSLLKAGNKSFETIEFEGLNHLFQTAKTGSPAEYAQIEETIAPQVLDKMSDWILKLK